MGLFDNIDLETEYLRTLSASKRHAYKNKSVLEKKDLLNKFKTETQTYKNKASHDIMKRFLASQGIYEPSETMMNAIEKHDLSTFTNQSENEPSAKYNLKDIPQNDFNTQQSHNFILSALTDKIIKQNEEIIHQNKKIIKLLNKSHSKK